jgi:hypothetical protein
MSWFEAKGEQTTDRRATTRQGDPRPSLHTPPVPSRFAHDLPTEPLPVTLPATADRPNPPISTEPDYDPSQPNQAPILGIDLLTFAVVSRRLMDTPRSTHAEFLASYGQTPQTWRAVNTAWVARLGQMPFLCAAYRAALQQAR